LLGAPVFWVLVSLGGYKLTSRSDLARQQEHLVALQQENSELTEELLRPRGWGESGFDPADLPYDSEVDARAEVAAARLEAQRDRQFLMITFGANWCLDCRTLHHHLKSGEVVDYTRDLFRFVNVDVGKFNQNRDLAVELDVDLRRGIPVAIFFDPEGRVIGTTNEGQLEPSRRYSSKQILKFVRDIAERAVILAPDSVK
jgi:protein disulfide-isomerase